MAFKASWQQGHVMIIPISAKSQNEFLFPQVFIFSFPKNLNIICLPKNNIKVHNATEMQHFFTTTWKYTELLKQEIANHNFSQESQVSTSSP